MKKTLSERTQKILTDLKINQVQLANLAGCTKGAVNQWLKASSMDSVMSPEYAYRLADQTDYEPRWLMVGEGPEKKSGLNQKEKALLDLYRATDSRGQSTILRAAEQESTYVIGGGGDAKKSA